ncbi:uncharacterized protein METZ01_LOCUS320803, partial [marine metagenome]
MSRSKIQSLIRTGAVAVNAARIDKTSHTVGPGDAIRVNLPEPQPSTTLPEKIPLDIVYEDDALLVVNKPAGLVVHPAAGHWNATLVNALLYHCDRLSDIGETIRPGIVHRLDKDTSGLLVVAKRDDVHMALAGQIEAHEVSRKYLAVAWGSPRPESGTIEAPVGRHPVHRQLMGVVERGKTAVTHYQVVKSFRFCSLLSLKLETGRTHQIRVHLAHQGNPVFGDSTYGGRVKRLGRLSPTDRRLARTALDLIPRQALHAAELEFKHPETGNVIACKAEVPEDMQAL